MATPRDLSPCSISIRLSDLTVINCQKADQVLNSGQSQYRLDQIYKLVPKFQRIYLRCLLLTLQSLHKESERLTNPLHGNSLVFDLRFKLESGYRVMGVLIRCHEYQERESTLQVCIIDRPQTYEDNYEHKPAPFRIVGRKLGSDLAEQHTDLVLHHFAPRLAGELGFDEKHVRLVDAAFKKCREENKKPSDLSKEDLRIAYFGKPDRYGNLKRMREKWQEMIDRESAPGLYTDQNSRANHFGSWLVFLCNQGLSARYID